MSDELSPAEVRLTDGLGPLPPAMTDYPDHGEQTWREEDMRAYAAQERAAERERWDTLLSAARRIADGNSKRADDCGMLSRALLDALSVLRA